MPHQNDNKSFIGFFGPCLGVGFQTLDDGTAFFFPVEGRSMLRRKRFAMTRSGQVGQIEHGTGQPFFFFFFVSVTVQCFLEHAGRMSGSRRARPAPGPWRLQHQPAWFMSGKLRLVDSRRIALRFTLALMCLRFSSALEARGDPSAPALITISKPSASRCGPLLLNRPRRLPAAGENLQISSRPATRKERCQIDGNP